MKKLNKKGFTLIELLAVVVIMGILMLVAIPAIQRIIENTRRDTFADTAKNYVNAARTMWLADSFKCRAGSIASPSTLSSAVGNGSYYILINSANAGNAATNSSEDGYRPYPFLLQQGGKSSWANGEVTGIIKVTVTDAETSNPKQSFSIVMTDGTHGIKSFIDINELRRANVATSGATAIIKSDGTITVDSDDVKKHLCEELS